MTAMRSVLGSPWLIVAGAFGVLSYSIASTFTFGVLLIYMQDDFDVGESVIGWIGSIHVFVYFISGLLVQPIQPFLGLRKLGILGCLLVATGLTSSAYCDNVYGLYGTYGLLIGAGTGIQYLVATTKVAQTFEKKRSLASGIAASGGGVGVMVLSKLRSATMNQVGWQNGLLFELIYIFLSLLCVILITRDDKAAACADITQVEIEAPAKDDTPHESTSKFCCSCPDRYKFIFGQKIIYVCMAFGGTISNAIISTTNFIPGLMTKDLDYSDCDATTLVLIVGITNIVSRAGSGLVGNHGVRTRYLSTLIILTIGGVMTLMLPFWNPYPVLIIHAIVTGTASGFYGAQVPVLLADIFGVEHIHLPISLVLASMALPLLVGYPLFGRTVEATGSHTVTFLIIGGLQMCAILTFITGGVMSVRGTRPKETQCDIKCNANDNANDNTNDNANDNAVEDVQDTHM